MECPSCKKISILQHPNLKFIFALPGISESGEEEKIQNDVREEIRKQLSEKAHNPYFKISIQKANTISIGMIREIRKETSLASYEEGKKIFIISQAEMMNEAASNALLKILEEPPVDTIFFFTTSRKEKLLSTILSRCQSIQCNILSEEKIAEALEKNYSIENQNAKILARISNGSYTRAIELLSEDISEQRKEVVQFLRAVLANSVMKFFEENENYLTTSNKKSVEQLFSLTLMWMRDVLILKERGAEGIINQDQQEDLQKFLSKFGNANISAAIETLENSLELLRRNVYLPLIIISLSIQLKKILYVQL